MIIITGTIRFESVGELERVKTALARRAARSRADVGNIDYVFTQNLEEPTEIRLVEKWESEAQLNEHLKVPDEEFQDVIGNARISSAVVVAHDGDNERVLLELP